MRITLTMAASACLALTGCESSDSADTTSAPTAVATPDPIAARIAALPEPMQRVTFFRAIQDAGYTCQQIVKVESRRLVDGLPVWSAVCDDDGQYTLVLRPGGIFNVSGVPRPKTR